MYLEVLGSLPKCRTNRTKLLFFPLESPFTLYRHGREKCICCNFFFFKSINLTPTKRAYLSLFSSPATVHYIMTSWSYTTLARLGLFWIQLFFKGFIPSGECMYYIRYQKIVQLRFEQNLAANEFLRTALIRFKHFLFLHTPPPPFFWSFVYCLSFPGYTLLLPNFVYNGSVLS